MLTCAVLCCDMLRADQVARDMAPAAAGMSNYVVELTTGLGPEGALPQGEVFVNVIGETDETGGCRVLARGVWGRGGGLRCGGLCCGGLCCGAWVEE